MKGVPAPWDLPLGFCMNIGDVCTRHRYSMAGREMVVGLLLLSDPISLYAIDDRMDADENRQRGKCKNQRQNENQAGDD